MGVKTRKLSNITDSLIEWQSVVVADGSTGLTAVAGRGYFINTTAGAITVTMPSSPKIGDVVQLKDYARTWNTNNVTIASTLLDGNSSVTQTFSTQGQTVTLVYMDGTKGWSLINEDTTTNLGASFITATGGTITTSGDYKIHSFTGDGCFVVSSVGNCAGGGAIVSYMVVAGGGGSGGDRAGGGGAGGFREGKSSFDCYSASPLNAPAGITVTATTYPITVGAGGAGDDYAGSGGVNCATNGSNSIFATITAAGGGKGASGLGGGSSENGYAGGSGGGAATGNSPGGRCGGAGNTPPTSPPQGNPGGLSNNPASGGGGGATVAGNGSPGSHGGGNGGAGATTSISGTPTAYAGGGGGGASNPGTGGTGGSGGGAAGAPAPSCSPVPSRTGTANRGGGGGGGNQGGGPTSAQGAAGGKGIVIIRYKYQ